MTVAVRSRPMGTGTEFVLDNGAVVVRVWTYGASLAGVCDRGRELVLRPPDPAGPRGPWHDCYIGSTLGRYARVVSDATATIDGTTYRLGRNAGRHHLHGGATGFDTKVWSGRGRAGRDRGIVRLTLTSPDNEEGYPGTLLATAWFSLDTADRVVVDYQAHTDRPTLCGLTCHAFWNLGDGTIDDHVLTTMARTVVETDAEFVPTGRLHDHPSLGRCSPLDAMGIDHCLDARDPGHRELRLACPATGHAVTLTTNQSCIAVYTGDALPSRRAGICLQPGPWPDTPHRLEFPSAELRPGERYRNRTELTLEHPT